MNTSLLDLRRAIDAAEQTELALERERFNNRRLQYILKIILRQQGGHIKWSVAEMQEADNDPRDILFGATEIELHDFRPLQP